MARSIVAVMGVAAGVLLGSGIYTLVRGSAAETPAQPALPPPLHADDSGATAEGTAAAVDAGTRFAFKLYDALGSEPGNVFFSPYSISTALGMVYEGARGETAAEIEHVFHFPAEAAARRPALAALHNALNPADAAYELSVANGLWAEATYAFLPDYLETVQRYYGGEAANMDFKGAPEPAREAINAWVEGRTRDRIRDLLPEGSVNPATRLVLANAIYFKGRWELPFEAGSTTERPFRGPDGETLVPTMYRTAEPGEYMYFENDLLQSLRLPYADRELYLQVLLPRADDPAALEAALSPALLAEIAGGEQYVEVRTWLPKFTFDSKYMLGDTLKQLGMPAAFTAGGADFSGMDGTRDLFISAVVHEGFVEVNEEGTEAAAATGVVMETTAALDPNPPQFRQFRADHPFVFLIRHNETGAILFLGRVEEVASNS